MNHFNDTPPIGDLKCIAQPIGLGQVNNNRVHQLENEVKKLKKTAGTWQSKYAKLFKEFEEYKKCYAMHAEV